MTTTRFDLPTVEDEHRPWWDAAREGRLLFRRCRACEHPHLYPRPFCPSCWSADVAWEPASGQATLYTWSVVRANDLPPFRDWVPYVAALVDLAEGPRLMTNVVDCDPDTLRIGQELVVAWRDDPDTDFVIPVFRPAA